MLIDRREGQRHIDAVEDHPVISTTSWGCWKHAFGIPGVRPMFLKPKLYKESKNGFKKINYRPPCKWFFQITFFGTKNHQEICKVLKKKQCQKVWFAIIFLSLIMNSYILQKLTTMELWKIPESLIICNSFLITNYLFLYFAKTNHNGIMKKSTCYLDSRSQFYIQLDYEPIWELVNWHKKQT